MKILITFLVFLIISCQDFESTRIVKNQNNEITESEIYEVINFILIDMKKSDSLENFQGKYIVDKTTEPFFITTNQNSKKKLKKYFTNSDFNFMENQLKKSKNFKLEQSKIIRKTIISKDTLDNLIDNNSPQMRDEFIINFEKKFGKYYYNEFSLPLFSVDKKTVLIEINSFLGGGRLIILKKKNQKWKSTIVSIWT
ncbi:hypothetical protein FBBAL38_07640 [Flavobacteria bacterium BAL38]|nr:hypothetical protein FBBAL38_07640 [Flavobacteria bacterium BAL38]